MIIDLDESDERHKEVKALVDFINDHFERHGRPPTQKDFDAKRFRPDGPRELRYELDDIDQWRSP
jgi:hypothetical protein